MDTAQHNVKPLVRGTDVTITKLSVSAGRTYPHPHKKGATMSHSIALDKTVSIPFDLDHSRLIGLVISDARRLVEQIADYHGSVMLHDLDLIHYRSDLEGRIRSITQVTPSALEKFRRHLATDEARLESLKALTPEDERPISLLDFSGQPLAEAIQSAHDAVEAWKLRIFAAEQQLQSLPSLEQEYRDLPRAIILENDPEDEDEAGDENEPQTDGAPDPHTTADDRA